MAPHGESSPGTTTTFSRTSNNLSKTTATTLKPPRLSSDHLQRTISDISFELSKEGLVDNLVESPSLPAISEVEDAKCECCGMSEECTQEYIERVREKFLGKFVCGLCSEAVKEEIEKNGGKKDEALNAHMNACVRFNKFGRAFPVLFQAEAMKEMLKKNKLEGKVRAKSISPRDHKAGSNKVGAIARSTSCIPALTREINDLTIAN